MGCSASRPFTAKKIPQDQSPSFASSSHSHCSSSSASHFSKSSPQIPRALSLPMPLVHHPPTKKGDSHHLVSLTSTTYGSLLLIDPPNQKDSNFNTHGSNGEPESPPHNTKNTNQTEPEKSLSPDSVINTWELMDGLDDDYDDNDYETSKSQRSIYYTPIMDDDASKKPSSCRYTTFDGFAKKKLDFSETDTIGESISSSPISPLSKKPLWKHLSEEALFAELDPNVASSYQRALSSRCLTSRSIGSSSPLSCSSSSFSSNKLCSLERNEDRIVVYFTSLRGIRKTYEDCCSVRMILKGFRVAIDEKDISMDLSYRKELQNLLGGKLVTLPQVFIRGKHVGNAEEIKMMNESGELANLLKGFPIKDPLFMCEICGDVRFVPCTSCNGSRKVFEKEEGEMIRCLDCNENGLIRCPGCCSS